MAPVFVDTNILLYARDSRDPAKQATASAWLRSLAASRQGRLSTQVLIEFYAAATHGLELGLSPAQARADVEALSKWQVIPSNIILWREAWRLTDAHSLSWWDALVVAAALLAGCGTLLSEDLQDGLVVDGTLTIVNPLAPGAPNPPKPNGDLDGTD